MLNSEIEQTNFQEPCEQRILCSLAQDAPSWEDQNENNVSDAPDVFLSLIFTINPVLKESGMDIPLEKKAASYSSIH